MSAASDAPLVLITGANRGLGLEFVRQYADDGWSVVATCRDPSSAGELADLASLHKSIRIEQLDIADGTSIDVLAKRLEDEPIDLLLNNAGTMGPLPLEEHIHRQRFGQLDYHLWAQILLTNTIGTVHMCEAFAPNVAASQGHTIVTLSSTAGSIGESERPAIAYTSSKAALNKAMTTVARTLAPQDIKVLIICPGHVKTRLGLGGASIEIPDSVHGVRSLIAESTMADSGTFRRYDGATVAW
jgi:NAD(P)-dependent dehydrogenase (short-subunit alcohol dehydrogenase family)